MAGPLARGHARRPAGVDHLVALVPGVQPRVAYRPAGGDEAGHGHRPADNWTVAVTGRFREESPTEMR